MDRIKAMRYTTDVYSNKLSRGINMRYLLCAFLLFTLTSCASVDQALYDVSNSVSSVDRVTGQRSLNFASRQSQISTSDAEIKKFIEEAKKENIALNEEVDKEDYERLKRVFKRVHQVSHLRDENWNVLLIPDDEFNAFVNGGTYVVVHSGLMKQIENDDELAAILGHEIAHVSSNHRYERQSHITVATLKGSKSARRDTFQAAFTHENEKEADEVGILYATLAGYDPYAASKVWKRMLDNEGDFTRVVVSHPINSERYKRAAELADVYNQYYRPDTINPDFATVLQTNSIFGNQATASNALAPGQGGGFLSLLEVTLDGVSKHYEAKAEEARQELRAQEVGFTEQYIDWVDFDNVGSRDIRVSAQYNGPYVLQNLTFIGIINDQESMKKIDHLINPGQQFQFNLEFDNPDISKLRIMTSHVEWLR